ETARRREDSLFWGRMVLRRGAVSSKRGVVCLKRGAEAATHNNAQTVASGAKRSRASTALTRSPDRVLHRSETTGGHAGTAGGCGHAETVGDGPRLNSNRPARRTGCCTVRKQQC
ncbi:MAG: hypothetical protein LBD24_06455, partial [Spirochaetaceae bacterium]|nr:hypothetical protein [Spirochaetaceae bacterium]